MDGTPRDTHLQRPGSDGEHALQGEYGSADRADRFYADQVRDRLLPTMVAFIGRMEMMVIASADAGGDCDASLRAGPVGFIRVLDARTVAYPEYRGNGVHASLGNIVENGHVGLLMVDFVQDLIGLHVNGTAEIVEAERFRSLHPEVPDDPSTGRRADRWVIVHVDEAYIHCRKHIPRMARVADRRELDPSACSSGPAGGDYFMAKGTPPTMPRPRRRFPSSTHLGGAPSRVLRSRPR